MKLVRKRSSNRSGVFCPGGRHYTTLYEQGGRRLVLLKKIAPMVFGDIRRMMLEHLVLQICVITDPPQSFGRKNLTVQWLLQNCDFAGEPAKFERLKELSKKMHEFREIILPARNRYISHLDVESTRIGDTLGAAEDSKWQQFWIDLEDFLEIVYGHYIGPNMRLSKIAQMSDAQLLVKALKESKYFQALLENNETTQLAWGAAESSIFHDA
jgi:AbiU2